MIKLFTALEEFDKFRTQFKPNFNHPFICMIYAPFSYFFRAAKQEDEMLRRQVYFIIREIELHVTG